MEAGPPHLLGGRSQGVAGLAVAANMPLPSASMAMPGQRFAARGLLSSNTSPTPKERGRKKPGLPACWRHGLASKLEKGIPGCASSGDHAFSVPSSSRLLNLGEQRAGAP